MLDVLLLTTGKEKISVLFTLQEEHSCFCLTDTCLRFCSLEVEPMAGFLLSDVDGGRGHVFRRQGVKRVA